MHTAIVAAAFVVRGKGRSAWRTSVRIPVENVTVSLTLTHQCDNILFAILRDQAAERSPARVMAALQTSLVEEVPWVSSVGEPPFWRYWRWR